MQKFYLCKVSHRPQAKRRRIELSLKTKIDLIRAAESVPKLNQKELAEKYGIGTSIVSDILKKKEEYCVEYEKNASSGTMRCKTACKYDELNELTWRWFSYARAKNITISGPIIKEKALKFAGDLHLEEFKASNGWLESWKGRFSIRSF